MADEEDNNPLIPNDPGPDYGAKMVNEVDDADLTALMQRVEQRRAKEQPEPKEEEKQASAPAPSGSVPRIGFGKMHPLAQGLTSEDLEAGVRGAGEIAIDLPTQLIAGQIDVPGNVAQTGVDIADGIYDAAINILGIDEQTATRLTADRRSGLQTRMGGKGIPAFMPALEAISENFRGAIKPADTATGAVGREISSFLSIFGPLFSTVGKSQKVTQIGAVTKKALGKFTTKEVAEKGGEVATQAVAGAVAGGASDLINIDAVEANLANWVQEFPALENPITEFLATDPHDNKAWNKLKNAFTGVGLGSVLDTVATPMRLMRANRIARLELERVASEGGKKQSMKSKLDELYGTDGEEILISPEHGEVALGRAQTVPVKGQSGKFRVTREGKTESGDLVAEGMVVDRQGRAAVGKRSRGDFLGSDVFGREPVRSDLPRGPESGTRLVSTAPVRVDMIDRFVLQYGIKSGDRVEDFFLTVVPDTADSSLASIGGMGNFFALGKHDPLTKESNALGLAGLNRIFKQLATELPQDIKTLTFERTGGSAAGKFQGRTGTIDLDAIRSGKSMRKSVSFEGGGKPSVGQAAPARIAAAEGRIESRLGSEGDTIEMLTVAADDSVKLNPVGVNWDNYDTSDNVKGLLDDVTQAMSDSVDEARRGVVTHKQTKAAADAAGITPEQLIERRAGAAPTDVEVVAYTQIHQAAAGKVEELARAIMGKGGFDPNAHFKLRKMVAIFHEINRQFMGARAESGRAFGAFRIKATDSVERSLQIATMLDGMGGEGVTKAMAARIVKLADRGALPGQLSKFAETSWLAKSHAALRESWSLGKLWAPATHIVNISSHYMVVGLQAAESGATGSFNQLVGNVGPDDIHPGEAMARLSGTMASIRATWGDVAARFREADTITKKFGAIPGGIEDAADRLNLPTTHKLEDSLLRSISTEAFGMDEATGLGRFVDYVGNVTRVPGHFLGIEDDMGKSLLYHGEIHAQAYRRAMAEGGTPVQIRDRMAALIDSPDESVRLAGINNSMYGTFTEPLVRKGEQGVQFPIARAWQSLQRIPLVGPLIFTYVRTPSNILRFGFERSPMAPMVGQWRHEVAAGGSRRQQALGKMAVGTTAMAVFADYAFAGKITGAYPEDPGLRAAMQRLNMPENSAMFGGRWFNYSRLDAVGMQMGVAANLVQAWKSHEIDTEDFPAFDEILGAIIVANSQSAGSKSWLQGVGRFVDAIQHDDARRANFGKNVMVGLVPATSAFSTLRRADDPTLPDMNSAFDHIQGMIIGWEKGLPRKHDLWGRVIEAEDIFGFPFERAFIPTKVRTPRISKIDEEMVTHDMGILNIRKRSHFDGVSMDLGKFPRVFEAYVKLSGNELKMNGLGAHDFLEAVVTNKHPMSPAYSRQQDGPEGGKTTFVRKHLDRYKKAAQVDIMRDPDGKFQSSEFNEFRDAVAAEKQRQRDLRAPR